MSALDDLHEQIQADLHLIRRDLKARLDPIRVALDRYERAVEEEAVREFCLQHSIKRPRAADVSREGAARLLLEAVTGLPELARVERSDQPRSEVVAAAVASDPLPARSTEDDVSSAFRSRFPGITEASRTGRLLLFGAFSGRTKTLPGPLATVADFVDTAREGDQKVSTASRRIKAGGIFGVIICDQAISHQHAEPAVHAARSAGVPVAYAGKGGNASLARAIEALEEQLAD